MLIDSYQRVSCYILCVCLFITISKHVKVIGRGRSRRV